METVDTHALLETLQAAQESGHLLPSALQNISAWVQADFLTPWALNALAELAGQQAWEELNDRFYQNIAFGTGGMRGRTIGRVTAPSETGTLSKQGTPQHPAVASNGLNDFTLIRATIALHAVAKKTNPKPKLIIAHDVRHFSRHFCELAASTWVRLGGAVSIFSGPRSTPQLSYAVRAENATCGVVITASHNPAHDNGFKAYFTDGGQVVSPHAENIVSAYAQVSLQTVGQHVRAGTHLKGVETLGETADVAYQNVLTAQILNKATIAQQKPLVVFTPIHGTGAITSVPVLKALGAQVEVPAQQAVEDPRFPSVKSPNPENAEALSLAIAHANSVGENGADCVLATDPDADRMGVAVRSASGEMQLLNGNQIGSLLAHSRIKALKAKGWVPEAGGSNFALIKTFVTTPLQAAIAKAEGIKCIDTLTGFKWIGAKLFKYENELKASGALNKNNANAEDENAAYDALPAKERFELLAKHSTAYVFGGEESYGYLADDSVRDKDANAACALFVELLATAKAEGKTILQYLDALYLQYGYYTEKLISIYHEGAAGAQKIKNILNSLRESPPTEIAGMAVERFIDFGREVVRDADGDTIPSQDFYMLELAGGYRVAVRGSGTEPKIKFYLFAHEQVRSADALDATKAKAADVLEQLASSIETGAAVRAAG